MRTNKNSGLYDPQAVVRRAAQLGQLQKPRAKSALSQTWFGLVLSLMGKRISLEALRKAVFSDYYYLKLIALLKLVEVSDSLSVRRELEPEVLMLLDFYKRLKDSRGFDCLNEICQRYKSTLSQPELTQELERFLMTFLAPNHFIFERDGRYYWSFYIPEVNYKIEKGKINTETTAQKANLPLIFLWQIIHDMDVVSREIDSWEKTKGSVFSDLCGDHLSGWQIHPQIQDVLSNFLSVSESRRLEMAQAITSIDEYPKHTLYKGVGAILEDAAGQIIGVGHDTPPFPVKLRLDEEVTGFGNLVIDGKKISKKEFGLRRSVCAEQRAILSAILTGGQLENASVYISLGYPCNQCLVALVNAGIRKIIFPLFRADMTETSLYADAQTQIILEQLQAKLVKDGQVGTILI